MKRWLVFDIGCIECGESSRPVGIFADEDSANAAGKKYITGDGWGREEWGGQHSVQVFEVDVP